MVALRAFWLSWEGKKNNKGVTERSPLYPARPPEVYFAAHPFSNLKANHSSPLLLFDYGDILAQRLSGDLRLIIGIRLRDHAFGFDRV